MASDPIRILIVDDDEDVLIALERLLEGEGYATITAWSARDAIVQTQESQFQILLVDENLGDNSPSILDDFCLCGHCAREMRLVIDAHRAVLLEPVPFGVVPDASFATRKLRTKAS